MNNKYGDKRMKLGNQFTAKYLHILLKETASETQNRAGGFLFDLICVRQAPGRTCLAHWCQGLVGHEGSETLRCWP